MTTQNRRTFVKAVAASAAAVAFSRLGTPQPTAAATGSATTNDGIVLRYEEAGSGKPLVCIPGWSQTAAQFKHQLSGLSDRYRVIAVDMRGHGESDKPDNGYTIQRLAKDVQDLLVARNLTDVTLMGHSMGSSVIWSYWQLWGKERLAKLIFVDQMPMITADPAWSAQEKEDSERSSTPPRSTIRSTSLPARTASRRRKDSSGGCSRRRTHDRRWSGSSSRT